MKNEILESLLLLKLNEHLNHLEQQETKHIVDIKSFKELELIINSKENIYFTYIQFLILYR